MKVGTIIVSVGALLLAASNAQAQFMPLEAKIRETTVKTVNGKNIASVKEGNYYRSPDGSTLTQWLTFNGDRAWDGVVDDNVALVSYHLDYKQNRAIQEVNHAGMAIKPGVFSALKGEIGTDSVEGISCKIVPVKMRLPGESVAQDVGNKLCASAQYDLRLWEQWIMPGERRKTELFSIKMGVEPDRSLFDIKSKFTIYTPSPNAPITGNLAESH